jgi:NAD(P)H-dependent FMN reductase
VRESIDALDLCSDDRVMQKTNWHHTPQCDQDTDRGGGSGSCARTATVAGTTVLVITGVSINTVSRGLTHAAALSAPSGITLNVFDSLAYLPPYSEALENDQLPRPAAALRKAAIEAHAAMVLTHYYGRIPGIVHNAIDWLTRGWNQSALHDKPLAVIGPSKGGYSGVWSRHHSEGSHRIAGSRIVEPITVTALHEAVTKLAEQANLVAAPDRYSRINKA